LVQPVLVDIEGETSDKEGGALGLTHHRGTMSSLLGFGLLEVLGGGSTLGSRLLLFLRLLRVIAVLFRLFLRILLGIRSLWDGPFLVINLGIRLTVGAHFRVRSRVIRIDARLAVARGNIRVGFRLIRGGFFRGGLLLLSRLLGSGLLRGNFNLRLIRRGGGRGLGFGFRLFGGGLLLLGHNLSLLGLSNDGLLQLGSLGGAGRLLANLKETSQQSFGCIRSDTLDSDLVIFEG
jgi:hypothetical protein